MTHTFFQATACVYSPSTARAQPTSFFHCERLCCCASERTTPQPRTVQRVPVAVIYILYNATHTTPPQRLNQDNNKDFRQPITRNYGFVSLTRRRGPLSPLSHNACSLARGAPASLPIFNRREENRASREIQSSSSSAARSNNRNWTPKGKRGVWLFEQTSNR